MRKVLAVSEPLEKRLMASKSLLDDPFINVIQDNIISNDYLACLYESVMKWSVQPIPSFCPSQNSDSGEELACPVFSLCSHLFPRR